MGLGLIHGLACVAVVAARLDPFITLGLLLLVGSAWSYYFSRLALVHGPWFIRHLQFHNHKWCMSRGGSEACSVSLVDSFCQFPLIILHFRQDTGERRSVIILADAVPREAWRYLSVLLKTVISRSEG